jgi:hypothetical protein
MNGYNKVMTFANGYSASIVSHDMSYGGNKGLFEIAVMYNGDIVYDTPVTSDVVGYLDFAGVVSTLKQIESLPARNS